MAPPDKEEDGDESMEDILQSIKQIIADDDDGDAPADEKKEAAPKEEKAEEAAPKEEKSAEEKSTEEEDVPGSDVLELTEVVEEEAAAEEAPVEDVLSQIDEAVGATDEAEEAPSAPVEAPSAPPPAPPTPAAPAAASEEAPGDPSLLSDEARTAAEASVEKLRKSTEPPPLVTTEFPDFSGGTTLEAIVCGMVRPMIKEWLDENLPAIVERIVDQEIRRITK